MGRNRLVVISLVVVATSCALEQQLLPDREAEDSPKATRGEAGVRVFVDAEAWKGRPSGLREMVTPVRVTLENSSGRPVRVAYEDVSLDGRKHYAALSVVGRNVTAAVTLVANEQVAPPPPAMDGWSARVAPRFQSRGFFVAERVRASYPRYEPWPRPLRVELAPAFDAVLGDDVAAEAVPEGVVENNGFVAGFFYFQHVDADEERLNLNFKLTDPDTRVPFGTLTVPVALKAQR